jgi:hypothetical protein
MRGQRGDLLMAAASLGGRIARKTEFVAVRVSQHEPDLPELVSSRRG